MNLKESIRRILREETEIPLFVRRRFTLEDLEWLVNDVKELIDYGESLDTAIYDGVREFIKSRKFSDIDEFGLEAAYWESYLKYEKPLVRYVKNRLNIQESVLQEETNPTLRRLLRRGSPENIDRIFESGLEEIANRYIKNKGKWYSMTLKTFRESVIPFVIVDLCTTYEDICTGGDFYEQTLDFLMKNYSDRIREKWEEINTINESTIKENKVENLIKQYLSEFGLDKTSEMMGISLSKVVEIAKIPINSGIANEILIENMIKGNIIDNYKEFIIHASNDGVFYWETNTRTGHFSDDRVEQITVAATPFWDGVDYTPVEIDWFTLYDKDMVNAIYNMPGEGNYFQKFTHQTNFETVEELNDWYNEVYLPGVYDIIMNKLLPKVYRRVDYELNPR